MRAVPDKARIDTDAVNALQQGIHRTGFVSRYR
jgi:hypothetical protein